MSVYQSLFSPDPYPKVRIIQNILVRFKELFLSEEDEEEVEERIKIIRNSEPDRPFQYLYFKYYYKLSRLLTRDLWYPDQQDWGAFYSIKPKIIPQHNLRLDCDGSYKRSRGGYGFVLRDSDYNPLFGGCGRSRSAVSSLYHEVEAIYEGLMGVLNIGWTHSFLEIYSDCKDAVQLIRRYDQLNTNEKRELGEPLGALVCDINRCLHRLYEGGGYKLDYICREGNFIADYLSKRSDVGGTQYLWRQEFFQDATLAYFVNRDRTNLDWRNAKPYLRYDKYTLEWLLKRSQR